jgi:DNA-directed RNA polymerase subunit E"
MPKKPFACGECNRILPEPEKKNEIPKCSLHESAPVSSDWAGYVVVMNPERSEIANRLNIEVPGSYALKVNFR